MRVLRCRGQPGWVWQIEQPPSSRSTASRVSTRRVSGRPASDRDFGEPRKATKAAKVAKTGAAHEAAPKRVIPGDGNSRNPGRDRDGVPRHACRCRQHAVPCGNLRSQSDHSSMRQDDGQHRFGRVRLFPPRIVCQCAPCTLSLTSRQTTRERAVKAKHQILL